MRRETLGDQLTIRTQIVVSEDCYDTETSAQLAEKSRAGLCIFLSSFGILQVISKDRYCHKVAGQDHQIWLQAVHYVDRASKWHRRKVFVVMKVAKLSDLEAVPGIGPPYERYLNPHQLRLVWLDNCSVCS